MSLSTVEPQASVSGAIFSTNGQSTSGRWSTVVIHYGSIRPTNGERGMRPLGSKSAYHFVVRNRADSWEDLLEVGHRWQRQMAGAYWAGPESQWVNHHGIGIWVEKQPIGRRARRRATSEIDLVGSTPTNRISNSGGSSHSSGRRCFGYANDSVVSGCLVSSAASCFRNALIGYSGRF